MTLTLFLAPPCPPPPTPHRVKNSDKVPGFIDRGFHPEMTHPTDLAARSDPNQVAGQQRFKYFKRPMLTGPEPVIIKQAPQMPIMRAPTPADEPRSKTMATQSDYRESDAQTTPWDPAYVLPPVVSNKQADLSGRYNCVGPELLTLRDMKFGDGLPPGLQEVRRIEKMREKRIFEATLPPAQRH